MNFRAVFFGLLLFLLFPSFSQAYQPTCEMDKPLYSRIHITDIIVIAKVVSQKAKRKPKECEVLHTFRFTVTQVLHKRVSSMTSPRQLHYILTEPIIPCRFIRLIQPEPYRFTVGKRYILFLNRGKSDWSIDDRFVMMQKQTSPPKSTEKKKSTWFSLMNQSCWTPRPYVHSFPIIYPFSQCVFLGGVKPILFKCEQGWFRLLDFKHFLAHSKKNFMQWMHLFLKAKQANKSHKAIFYAAKLLRLTFYEIAMKYLMSQYKQRKVRSLSWSSLVQMSRVFHLYPQYGVNTIPLTRMLLKKQPLHPVAIQLQVQLVEALQVQLVVLHRSALRKRKIERAYSTERFRLFVFYRMGSRWAKANSSKKILLIQAQAILAAQIKQLLSERLRACVRRLKAMELVEKDSRFSKKRELLAHFGHVVKQDCLKMQKIAQYTYQYQQSLRPNLCEHMKELLKRFPRYRLKGDWIRFCPQKPTTKGANPKNQKRKL